MLGFAVGIDAHGLLVQQLGFFVASCLGLNRTRVGLKVAAKPQ